MSASSELKEQFTLSLVVPWRPRWRCSRRGGRYTRKSRGTAAVTRPCRRSTKARHAWSFQFHRTRRLDERRPFEPSTRVPISCNRCGHRVKEEAIKFIFSKVSMFSVCTNYRRRRDPAFAKCKFLFWTRAFYHCFVIWCKQWPVVGFCEERFSLFHLRVNFILFTD